MVLSANLPASSSGKLSWETKRAKAWSDGWLAKLRDDQRRSGADIALIISHALPKHIEQFDLVDGVWVAHPRCALPVAVALRQGLIDVSSSRLVQQGQQSKIEQVYHYRDRDVRQALHRKVLKERHGDADTLVLDELGLRHGTCRVDIAVVNGYLHDYEIKSDADTLVAAKLRRSIPAGRFAR
ncbi:DUF2130 domain-containing protein [Bradyrhizobium macuxiense]|uniref:DUF2130 domain-containing protein n=1 Tax=Bradyrhizobium macuxiense TaxID=1755647 RepID=UPI0024C0ADA7|nr:DUF2130 domain-containing protein [Bradyrhizobium macuxiense]